MTQGQLPFDGSGFFAHSIQDSPPGKHWNLGWVALTTMHVQCLGAYQLLSHSAFCQSPIAPNEVGEDYQTYFIDEVDRLREANGFAQGHTAAR